MRLLLILALYNSLNIILAELDIINEDLGDLHFNAEVGNLPLKYVPLSETDKKASEKAADFIDFIALVPNIDPLKVPVLPPFSFDIPFLWFHGKVYLENVVLAGVKQLQLNQIELRLINLRADMNISIPHIFFETDFALRAKLSFLPVMVKCHISANLYDLGVALTAGGYKAQSPTVGDVLQIDSAQVKFNVNRVLFNITNMVIGEEGQEPTADYDYADDYSPVSNFFSSRFSDNNENYDMINSVLKTAIEFANNELFKVTITAFTDYLLSDSY